MATLFGGCGDSEQQDYIDRHDALVEKIDDKNPQVISASGHFQDHFGNSAILHGGQESLKSIFDKVQILFAERDMRQATVFYTEKPTSYVEGAEQAFPVGGFSCLDTLNKQIGIDGVICTENVLDETLEEMKVVFEVDTPAP